jgi:hypothetical protein
MNLQLSPPGQENASVHRKWVGGEEMEGKGGRRQTITDMCSGQTPISFVLPPAMLR